MGIAVRGETMRATKNNLMYVIYSPIDGDCKAIFKHDAMCAHYFYRDYKKRNTPKCVREMVENTPAVRSITFEGKTISEIHGTYPLPHEEY